MLRIDGNEVVEDDSSRVDKMVKNLFKFKKSKNEKSKNLTRFKTIR